jgi:hypothetical protein
LQLITVAFCCSLLAASAASSQGARKVKKAARQIESMLVLAPKSPAANKLRQLNIVLLADKKDHGPNEHDYPLWQKRWSLLIGGKRRNGGLC